MRELLRRICFSKEPFSDAEALSCAVFWTALRLLIVVSILALVRAGEVTR